MSTDPNETSGLDKTIASVFTDLDGFTSETDEFRNATDQLVKLHALKMAEKTAVIDEIVKIQSMEHENRPLRVTPDTLALVASNLIGILVIVGYEQKHIVSSKALGFLGKLR